MLNRLVSISSNPLADIEEGVEAMFRKSFKDAVQKRTEDLDEILKSEIISVTDERVYSYRGHPNAMRKRRKHEKFGVGDPRNYDVFAVFPKGERLKNVNMRIVFVQKRNILTQGYSEVHEDEIDFSTMEYGKVSAVFAQSTSMTSGFDARTVVEKNDAGFKAAFKQPMIDRSYFEIAATNAVTHSSISDQVAKDIAASLRGMINSQGWKKENWVD